MDLDVRFRLAKSSDLPGIIILLADDPLGATREGAADLAAYERAFAEIDADPNNELCVAEIDDLVAGVVQITFIPQLTYRGGRRAQLEGVRVAERYRGRGLGARLIEWTIERARLRSCHLVQLTTDTRRPEALRFYQRIGFSPTHHGLKLHLEVTR
jgi:GNAT superfamily N-acetyltransferase